ncbi:UDP-diphosphatase [Roseivirga sp. 4D4]|uniref:undecaprenyl-diphosphate phosphatase n=1 Tax=Roseivirga sp. 4D4 TaxID=1889784 RepID=UPI000853B781|nr:undecaprenyl-diphosphate phosphatase [Roseivirga sp. 4D4]OEK00529.1 UDP-diphosphatase [Roseivirga sp. 4D4]
MSLIEAIVLGIVQGLTEFLPVSSSGHLELTKTILGDNSVPEESLMMTVVLHAATALSTIVIFRKDIIELLSGLFQFKNNEQFQYSLKIVISMIPAAVVGVLFEEEIEQLFGGQILLVGLMLLVTGTLLFLTDKAKNTLKNVSLPNALVIGIAQAIAILPGISRSGATISTSVLLGVDRQKAARFSFLMVVPLILGKMVKDIASGDLMESQTKTSLLIVGFIAAFIAGLLACQWMIGLVRKSQLKYFSFYCYIVGLAAIIYTLV